MNAKKCKAIRQQLRSEGVDVRETEYVGGTRNSPVTLKRSSGRARYLAQKKAA